METTNPVCGPSLKLPSPSPVSFLNLFSASLLKYTYTLKTTSQLCLKCHYGILLTNINNFLKIPPASSVW